MKENLPIIISAIVSIVTLGVVPIVTAWLQNRDKFNPNAKALKEIQACQEEQAKDIKSVKEDIKEVKTENSKMRDTQKAILQNDIGTLADVIAKKVDADDKSCHNDFLRLVVTYKEYHESGYNHWGSKWFDTTLKLMEKYDKDFTNNTMQAYYPNYIPEDEK